MSAVSCKTRPMTDLVVDPHQRRCLELAWEGCAAGTIGVGAVLVAGDGSVIAEGSNGISAAPAAGPLSNSKIAHAEMNVLAQLPPDSDVSTAKLYTSLEPCLMCTGAITMHNLSEVRVLAADPLMHGIDAVVDKNDWAKANWAPRDFSINEESTRLATLFAAYSNFATKGENHPYVRALTEDDPMTAQWVNDVIASGRIEELAAANATLDEVAEALL